jgi:predicted nucleic acid-binding protein
MKVVVDTNIVFSSILNTNSKLARILLQTSSKIDFYSTEQLIAEVEEHKQKIKGLTNYTNAELEWVITLVVKNIRFINVQLISKEAYKIAAGLTKDVDIDDTEFVALTEHLKGRLWSGDKELQKGLQKKGWSKFISTDELLRVN